MKNKRLVIFVFSAILLFSIFTGLATAKNDKDPLSQIWSAIFGIQGNVENLQNQVEDLEVASGARRYVIEGSFDVAQAGDLIKYESDELPSSTQYHWKKIDVPQLTLSDMPLVEVYVKASFVSVEGESEPMVMWMWFGPVTGGGNHVYLDEGCIYIEYKTTGEYIDFWTKEWKEFTQYKMNGDYKIILIK